MAREFRLPDLGEGIHEGEVIAVLVSVGDTVAEGDPILEVETDKAAVEIPSPFTGAVAEIMVKAGDTAKVGDVMMTFKDEEAVEGAVKPVRTKKPEQPSPEAPTPGEHPTGNRKKGPVPATPATRRLARDLGVDLFEVTPSGPKGQVTADDIRAFASSGPDRPAQPRETTAEDTADELTATFGEALDVPDFSRWGPVEAVPLRSIRKATARQMGIAWSQIPHVSSQDDIDITRLEALRRRHKSRIESLGGRLTLTVFAVKAAAALLKKHPQFNSSLDLQNGLIIRKKYIHIGVATDTGEGLVVPVLRNVDQKSLSEIAADLTELIERTRKRNVGLDELQGGSFTITNIGAAGGRGHFAPIINFPEAAILGMSAARVKPVAQRKKSGGYRFVPRLMMPVVLSIDHRLLDGVDSTRFLDDLRQLLEDPEQMLLNI